jgi:hypothetical protein
VLHITNGQSTIDILKRAGVPGAFSEWADVLHEGPAPGGVSPERWRDVRARYLAESGYARYDEVIDEFGRWTAALESYRAHQELVLWFEHDLFDQLNLIQVLDWLSRQPDNGTPVTLVCIGSFPGRPRVKGLGELTPGELAPLVETRQPIGEAQLDLARRAWSAFTSSDPAAIERLLDENTSALPFLGRALRRHLEEFPWTGDGLSRTERRLLELANGGPIDLHEAFPRMHDGEDGFYIGDVSFWRLARELAALDPPLVTLDFESADHAPPKSDIGPSVSLVLQGSLAIAPAGRGVLTGRADRITLCGIDRWLGGVHLTGRVVPWRWDPQRQTIVRV